MTDRPAVLEVADLRVGFPGTEPVRGVSFTLHPGQTHCVVGESGSGKSLTALAVMGLLPRDACTTGTVRFAGAPLPTGRAMARLRGDKMAMIFQEPMTSLNPAYTVGSQLTEVWRRHRPGGQRAATDRAADLLGRVGIAAPGDRMGQFPHQLSGGLRQRVMIAIALACEPAVLLADEPTTALDVTIQAQILALLDDLKDRLGMATLLVTHDMGVVAGRTSRINVMYAGRIVESAPTDELFVAMRHPYTQGLLGSIPRMDQDTRQPLLTIPGIPPDLSNPPAGCRFAARCPRATDQCRENEPPLTGDDPAHVFACWHPVDGPLERRIDPSLASPVARAARGENHLLEITHAVREYPVTAGALLQRRVGSVKAVSDVSLYLDKGETLGLVGESGCGKTTLGKMIVGIEKPDGGTVTLEGNEIFKLRGRELRHARRDLQMMFQDPYSSLDPRMRVGAILNEPLVIQDVGTRKERDQRVRKLMDEVGLPINALERYPHEFSGGQRQRIGLARTLVLEPKVIVADEPVSALDVSIRSQVLNLMKRLQAEYEMSSVVISHDLAVVKYLADRIAVMYLGKVVEIGSGDDIYRRQAHPYTEALIKTIPLPDPRAERAKDDAGIRGELPSPVNPPSGCRFRTRCPRARDLCAAEEPALRSFGPGHQAACHFPLQPPTGDNGEAQTAGSSASSSSSSST